jgi:hypothetical protein
VNQENIISLERNRTTNINVHAYTELLYRCRFSELLTSVSQLSIHDLDTTTKYELSLLRASALAELGDMASAKCVMEALMTSVSVEMPLHCAYAAARLQYMNGHYSEASSSFNLLLELADVHNNVIFWFRSGLGLANIAYTEKNWASVENWIQKLSARRHEVGAAEQMSLDFVSGHLAGFGFQDEAKAEAAYMGIWAQASKLGWTYFQKRSLYFLASIGHRRGIEVEANACLSLLRNMLSVDIDVHFARLVEERFSQKFARHEPIRINHKEMAVSLAGNLWNLHECPQMFRFVERLHQADGFVSKAELAKALWPNENYRKYLHDPRIFDLAKRFRKRLEDQGLADVQFLSGRAGYQLLINGKRAV